MSQTNAIPKIAHATNSNFRELVLDASMPVLVDFYAEWCGPCKRLAPVLEELAAEMPAARIVKVNVDDNRDLAMQFGVDSIPSLKVFRGGKVTAEGVGLMAKRELKEMLMN